MSGDVRNDVCRVYRDLCPALVAGDTGGSQYSEHTNNDRQNELMTEERLEGTVT